VGGSSLQKMYIICPCSVVTAIESCKQSWGMCGVSFPCSPLLTHHIVIIIKCVGFDAGFSGSLLHN